MDRPLLKVISPLDIVECGGWRSVEALVVEGALEQALDPVVDMFSGGWWFLFKGGRGRCCGCLWCRGLFFELRSGSGWRGQSQQGGMSAECGIKHSKPRGWATVIDQKLAWARTGHRLLV